MALRTTERRYGAVTQLIHWLTAGLVLWAWLIAGQWRGGGPRELLATHQTLGLAVFVLVVIRIIWRVLDRGAPRPAMARPLAIVSGIGHGLLYLLLLAVPLTAIFGRWLEGRALNILVVGNVEPWVATSRDVGERLLGAHEALGTLIIIIAGLHAVAAIFHHVVLRDRVLRRMLPVG